MLRGGFSMREIIRSPALDSLSFFCYLNFPLFFSYMPKTTPKEDIIISNMAPSPAPASPVAVKIRNISAALCLGMTALTGCDETTTSASVDGGTPSVKIEIGTAVWAPDPVIVYKSMDGGTAKTPDTGNKQFFRLGEHDVLSSDKIDKKYVSKITGSVDVVTYTDKEKPAAFYKEINDACDLMIQIHKNKPGSFAPTAKGFIDANMPLLTVINNKKPKGHYEFLSAMDTFSHEEIYGSDGVLNLILAFNRVTSKLEPGSLKMFTDTQVELNLIIDLKMEETRSVEVAPFEPVIPEPEIPTRIPDFHELTLQKRLLTDGTYEVTYSFIDDKGQLIIPLILKISPASRMVQSTWFYRRTSGPVFKTMTFDDFNKKTSKSYGGLWGLSSP